MHGVVAGVFVGTTGLVVGTMGTDGMGAMALTGVGIGSPIGGLGGAGCGLLASAADIMCIDICIICIAIIVCAESILCGTQTNPAWLGQGQEMQLTVSHG